MREKKMHPRNVPGYRRSKLTHKADVGHQSEPKNCVADSFCISRIVVHAEAGPYDRTGSRMAISVSGI